MIYASLVISLLLVCSGTHACERIEVTVPDKIDFETVSRPFLEISKMAGGIAFGATHVESEFRVQGCKVELVITKAQVLVMAEANQCVRDDIIRHELIHVDIWRKAVQALPSTLKSGDVNAGIDSWYTTMKTQHRALDTHEEYEKNYTTCDRGYLFAVAPYAKQIREFQSTP